MDTVLKDPSLHKADPLIMTGAKQFEQCFSFDLAGCHQAMLAMLFLDEDQGYLGYERLFSGEPKLTQGTLPLIQERVKYYQAMRLVVGYKHPKNSGIIQMNMSALLRCLRNFFQDDNVKIIDSILVVGSTGLSLRSCPGERSE